jgi:hypothetical protein
MSVSDYQKFLASKSQLATMDGFEPLWLPDWMFDFQQIMTTWAIQKGRALLIEECGLGKGPQQLVFCENVIRKTNGKSLIMAPLAVAHQLVTEAEKFGIDAKLSRDGKPHKNITIGNYESIHKFDEADFNCVSGDEISAAKAFDGKRRKQITRFMSKMPYRLGATATAAPNDYIELGTISELLGHMTQSDMLGTFFKSSDKKRHSLFKEGDFWNRAKYFFRAHSEDPFWKWVCSWARAIRSPKDIGCDDSRFILPELTITQHVVPTRFRFPGELFVRVAVTLAEQREERKRSLEERCQMVAKLVDHKEPALVWCQYNQEGELLTKLIPGAVEVAGRHSDEEKAERLNGFAKGEFRVLVTKPKIACFGLNYQHCGHHTFFPSHSHEQWHQCIRRSLRFGRVGPVRCDVIATEGEAGVTDNLKSKQVKAEKMFDKLIRLMNHGEHLTIPENHIQPMEIPAWL